MFLLPRPRRELASVLAPTQRRAPPREMAPPRGRRRDQPRASGERRSAATMRRNVVTPLPHAFPWPPGPLRVWELCLGTASAMAAPLWGVA